MSTVVVERRIAELVGAPGRRPLTVVTRARRRGRWAPVHADAVVDALDAVGPGAIVLARPHEADPGAAMVAAVARLMGVPVVLLPGDPAAAAWALAVALHPDFEQRDLVRRLEVLVGMARPGAALPRRAIDTGAATMPSLRPRVLSRWSACAWRPCARCAGGGPAGASCARCGAAALGGAP